MLCIILEIRDFGDFFASDFSGVPGGFWGIFSVWGGNCGIGGALNAMG
jgi:hypothetical protein